jgi:hypothetical protein
MRSSHSTFSPALSWVILAIGLLMWFCAFYRIILHIAYRALRDHLHYNT